jgi:membrane fusion protein, multidrug efflux system
MTPDLRRLLAHSLTPVVSMLLMGCGAENDGKSGKPESAVPVVVAPVVETEFTDAIEALGTTRANESATITANITEKILVIGFEDGAHLRKGDLIARLDDTAEQAELKAAQALLTERQRALARSKALREKNIVSQAEYEVAVAEMESAAAQVGSLQAAIGDRIIRAPFAGRVGLREVSVGSLIQPGSVITTLDDLSVMKVDFTLPAVQLSTLQPGLAIRAHTSAFPDRVFEGKLASVATQVDAVSRSIAARAHIPNPDEVLRPGMLIELELLARVRNGLSIPEAALVPRGSDQFVYVLDQGQARQRKVTLGTRRAGSVEILEGLTSGERVIVHGTLKLADGKAVNVLGELDGTRSIEDILRASATPKPG